MEYIIFVPLIFGILLIYFVFRNNWVFARRQEWNDTVAKYRLYLIDKKNWEIHDTISYQDMLNATSSYNKMFGKFWIWNTDKFIEDPKLFQLITEKRDDFDTIQMQ